MYSGEQTPRIFSLFPASFSPMVSSIASRNATNASTSLQLQQDWKISLNLSSSPAFSYFMHFSLLTQLNFYFLAQHYASAKKFKQQVAWKCQGYTSALSCNLLLVPSHRSKQLLCFTSWETAHSFMFRTDLLPQILPTYYYHSYWLSRM